MGVSEKQFSGKGLAERRLPTDEKAVLLVFGRGHDTMMSFLSLEDHEAARHGSMK